ncbi:hypothetical protein NTD86_10200 [Pseudomonas sp. 7P_10.2_Bac1]|uniref:NEL-type E3 ubiquitin ligase domain-containing protein n=1 Tax=Pseudomonas sp. 7P_10.2_Bac1 TaxID=2971614 RepID=UPI0021C74780|nr:NEL-type E3 ubiquitin ligase domain-containing protein [Pseudomonas sp. 7P_10.2_Bac1]MCU1727354.1 hypothetical protein [Pseudomonas sp. 7P_10.2_Bac1]
MTDNPQLPVTPPAATPRLKPSELLDAVVSQQHEALIAQQLPQWFKGAPEYIRAGLRQTMMQWHAAQAEVAAVYARVTPIEKFAEPLLKTALAAYGWSHINPRTYGLKQVRLLDNPVIFIANQQLNLIDSVAQWVLPESWIPASLEVNLVSNISRHDLLQAALQSFAAAETVKGGMGAGSSIYRVDNNQFVDVPEFEPETFARICSDLNIGEQYQWHLSRVFNPVENEYAATDPRSKAHKLKTSFSLNKRYEFMAELYVAFMKGHLVLEDFTFILNAVVAPSAVWDTRHNLHSTFELMGFEVPGMIVLWPEKRPATQAQRCIVYLPQAPDRTFFAFAHFDQFKVELREWLKRREFSDYFVKYVPLRYRAEFIRRTDLKNVSWDSLLLVRAPVVTEPALFNESRLIPQLGDPFEIAWLLQLEQIKDDARMLAIPTADEDSKARLERQAAFWNAGLSALALAVGFVPVVGELMLLFGVIQLGVDIYEGIKAWQRDDKVAALEHLFDVAQNLALVAAPGAFKTLKPTPAVDRMVQVTLGNGQKRLWKPDLRPYEQPPELLDGLKPDAQGLYTIHDRQYLELDQKVYRVKGNLNSAQMAIDALHPEGYSPVLRHNGSGAWTHELDEPMQWSRLKLFRRLGLDTELFTDAACEQILLTTDTTEGELRSLYIDILSRPPLLADGIERVRSSVQIETFCTEMKRPAYNKPDFAPLQLQLLTELPGWPHDHTLRVLDLQRGTFKDYGPPALRAYARVEVTQAQIDAGELLKTTVAALSNTQVETLLGEGVSGAEAQAKALAIKLGNHAQATKRTLVSRFYASDSVLTPAQRNIRNKFSTLPVNVLDELISHLTPDEVLALTNLGRLPLHALEESRRYAQRLRLNRAIEGIFCDALSTADSQTLAWHTLKALPGWPGTLRLEVRNQLNNQRISVIEGMAGQPSREIFKKGEQYEYYDPRTRSTITSTDLTACVFASLTDNERLALNSGAVLTYPAFMSRIATLAAGQRANSAKALGMQPIKPWFRSPMQLADGRVGYTLGGRSGHLRVENQALVLKDLVRELYPNMSDVQVSQHLSRLQMTPALAARELVRLKAELEGLRRTLLEWEEASVWTHPVRGPRVLVPAQTKRSMSRALIRAWRRLSTSVTLEGHAGYELDLNGWPVDALPSLRADFGHVISLHVANISCAIPARLLAKFPELRDLSLNNCQLVEFPSSIATMPELTYLNLRNNQMVLTAESATVLSGLSKLKSVVLTGNPLGHNFSVQQMANLQHLILRYTGVNTWPEGIQSLSNLQTLDLRNNAISHIPAELLTEAMAPINRVTSLHDNPLSPDSVRRMELYRNTQLIDAGIAGAHQHGSRTQGINLWADEPSAEQSNMWNELLRHSDSTDFFGLIDDLSTTSQFSRAKEDLTRRVWTLLRAAYESTDLRRRLFTLAGHLRTCSDGIAMVFADLELDYQVFMAEHSAQSERALLTLARGLYRIDVLNRHVLSIIKARINTIHATQREYVQQLQDLIDTVSPDFAPQPLAEMDPVELQGVGYRLGTSEGIRLAALLSPGSVQRQIARLDPMQIQMFYHVNLSSQLELPSRPTSMRFENIANVSDAELETAKGYVLAQEQMPALVESIAGQDFWSEYLRKKTPESFSAVLARYQESLDEVYSQRTTLSSEEYKRESDRVGRERNKAIADVVTLLTKMELERHPLPGIQSPGSSRPTDA